MDRANHAKVPAKAAAKAAAVKAKAKPEPAPTTLDDVRAHLEATAPAPAPADAGGALARPTSGLPQPGVGGCAAGQLNGACASRRQTRGRACGGARRTPARVRRVRRRRRRRSSTSARRRMWGG